MTPTPEQAALFAKMLDAGVPAEEAIALCAPEMREAEWPVYAERWPTCAAVRKARIALADNVDWLAMPAAQRQEKALEIAYNSMAYFVATHPIAEQETAKYAKGLKFIELLEKKRAGNAGADDGLARFLSKLEASGVLVKPSKAIKPERVQ